MVRKWLNPEVYAAKHRRKYAKRIAEGRCRDCGKPIMDEITYTYNCIYCSDYHAWKLLRYRSGWR